MTATQGPDAEVLRAFRLQGARVHTIGQGLINATFGVESEDGRFILQRVNPIFAPENHRNIQAVCEHLQAAELSTPRLRAPTKHPEQPWLEHEGETWRLMTRLEGHAFDRIASPEQAAEAARFVARWHAALANLEHEFVSTRSGVHDTPKHLASLRDVIQAHSSHALYDRVAPAAETLFARVDSLESLPSTQLAVAHGDLKLNNLLFASGSGNGALKAQALIDLDTVAPMPLAHEMGDALRSWCNPAGEDTRNGGIDREIFAAASRAYLEASGQAQDAEARQALVIGPEWISLELAARFLADALNESYFGWDATKFESRGHHNLERALGQWALHEGFFSTRSEREGSLG